MKTVLILAGLISLTMSDSLPTYDWKMNTGVRVIDVTVDNLGTYFDKDVSKPLQLTQEELKKNPFSLKPFSITIDVKSDTSSNAIIKIFMGPKYDINSNPVNLEVDWIHFFKLDWFVLNLNHGNNQVKRSSSDFKFGVPTDKIWKLLANFPKKLILSKDTSSVYLLQLFIFIYPFNGISKEDDVFKKYIADNKPFDYPFKFPVQEAYFKRPNMLLKDVEIYHVGEMFLNSYSTPTLFNVQTFY